MSFNDFTSDFHNRTGLSFWLFLFIMFGGMTVNSILSKWLRRRFPELYRPRNLLLMLAASVVFIAVALLINPPSEIRKELERSGQLKPPPKPN